MKHQKKRILGILLSFALMLTMMPVLGLSQTAYADADTWSANKSFDSDASFPDGVNITENITVTIASGKTVTVENGINAEGKTLTVKGGGSLVVTGAEGDDTVELGGAAFVGSIVVKGGIVDLTGGAGGKSWSLCGGQGIRGNITVEDGTVSVTGGVGSTSEDFSGGGGTGIEDGSVTVSGGSLTVTGGKGSIGGSGLYGLGKYPNNVGVNVSGGTLTVNGGDSDNWGGNGAVSCYIAVSGGTVTITGGNGASELSEATYSVHFNCINGWTAQESYDGSIWGEYYEPDSEAKYVRAVKPYPLWVGGVQVTSANMSGDGWSYTPAITGDNAVPAKLTLNSFNCSESGDKNAAIYAEEDLVIETTGTNTVANTSTASGTRAIGVAGELTFKGSGTLNATGGNRTIEANAVTIESGTVNTSNGNYGIYASSGDVIIKNGTVIATNINNNPAIWARKNITIQGGNVKATGYIGIQASAEKLMIEGGIISATGTSFGIAGSSVAINNGTIEATSTGSYGIFSTGEITINGGQVTAASGSTRGISGTVKNSIAGTGWTDTAGKEGKANIAVGEHTIIDLAKFKKVQFPAAHTHDFTYTASGDTITATCTAEGCPLPEVEGEHVATLTIAAPLHTTYGDGKDAAAQITDANSIQGEAKVQYQKKTGESTYDTATETAPTDAGTYKASITLGTGDNSATAHVVYDIAKATPTISTNPTASAITYGQTLENSTLTGGEASVPGTFAWISPTTKPNAAGSSSYEATFTPTDTSNYNTATCNVSLTVNQKEIGLSWTNTNLTYNGQEQAPTATATELESADEGKVDVTVTGGQTNASATAYTATASGLTGEKSGNYKLPTDNTTMFTISPKSITGASVTLDKTELTFNGSSQTINVTGVSLDGVNLDANTDYDVSGNTETNKGDYTVTVTGKDNYTGSATANWKIVAKAMTVVANPVSKTYDGNEYGITVNVTDPSDGTTVKYGTEKGTYDKDESPKYKDAGTYTVYFKVSGNSNYNDYEGSATVTISKKPVTASVSAEDKTYDGKTDAAVNASVKDEDLISGDSVEISGLKGSFETKDVGAEKTVNVDISAKTISGTGADNYEVTIPENAKATISKADATVKVKDQSIKVGDAVPDLSNPVLGKDYTVEGLVGGDALTTVPKLEYASKPDNTKPGTYEITASNASAGDNYDLSYQKGTLTISEKPAPAPTSKPVLAAKGIAKGKTAVNLSWNKVSGADRYVIYFARCNQKGRSYVPKKVKTVNGKTLKWSKGKLAKNTAYKFYVVAQKKSGKSYKNIAKSKVGHFYTGNVKGKYTNPRSLTLKKSAYTLKKGKTATIKASVSKVKTNKKLATSHAATYRYTSNNPAVATVNAKGKVTAKAKGTAVIYVQTINGIWKTCKVTVN